jgi:hypothetical protein
MNTQFKIILKPHGAVDPIVTYSVGNQHSTLTLTKITELVFDCNFNPGLQKFILHFNSKTNETPDMAVEIVSIDFEGMTLDRFKWAGKYYPVYPEPWASQQPEPLPEYQPSATFLGWNGRWELQFETPIFLWIHQLENLGWVYS